MGNYYLFARPSFFSGMARVLDLGGTLNEYNYSSDTGQADYYALHSDWKAVGADLLTAAKKLKKESTFSTDDTLK